MQARWFGLFPVRSPLLRESIFLSAPAANEMFQFTAYSVKYPMYSDTDNSYELGFPIRKSLGHSVLTAHQSLS
jgi:hypothetical protein